MTPCPKCQQPLALGARFCPACGEPQGNQRQQAVVSDGVDLLGVAPGDARPPGRPLGTWPLVAVGAVAVLVLGWLLLRTPQDSVTNQDEQAESTAPTTTSAPTEDESTGNESTETAPTETAPTETAPTTTTTVALGPLFDTPTGLSVFLESGNGLRRVDLDTGVIHAYDTRSAPVFATADWLLLADRFDAAVGRVPVNDADAEPMPLPGVSDSGIDVVSIAAGDEPGRVWFATWDEELRWKQWDLETVELVGEVAVPAGPLAVFVGSPEVSSSISGGIFELVDGTQRRVGDGTVIAVSRDYVLAEICNGPLDCELAWLDRDNWQRAKRPVPPTAQLWGARLSPDGSYLSYYGGRDSVLFDVRRGHEVEEFSSAAGSAEVVGFSPDSRIVAWNDGLLHFYDTVEGDLVELPSQIIGFDSWEIVFVPTEWLDP